MSNLLPVSLPAIVDSGSDGVLPMPFERTGLTFAALVLAACGDGASRPITELSVDTLADGSVWVSNPSHGLWDARPGARWRLAETLRIGSAVADDREAFGEVVSFTLDDLGRLWIGDSMAREVRVFDAGGRFVRVVGRPGRGPGEFERVGAVRRGPEGHIWVSDSDLGRFEVFDTTGTRVGGHRMPGRFGGFWRGGDFFQPFYAEGSDRRMYRMHRLGAGGSLEPDGRIFALPEPPPEPPMIEYSDGVAAWHLPAPYTPVHDWQVASGRDFWWSDGNVPGGRYEIRHIDFASGRTLRTVVRHFRPAAISDSARIAAVESVLQSVRTDRRLASARRPSEGRCGWCRASIRPSNGSSYPPTAPFGCAATSRRASRASMSSTEWDGFSDSPNCRPVSARCGFAGSRRTGSTQSTPTSWASTMWSGWRSCGRAASGSANDRPGRYQPE